MERRGVCFGEKNMIDAEGYLANLRNSYLVPVESQQLAAEDFPELPPSIVHALNRGWAVAPVFTHAHSASIKRSMAGFPTTDPASLVPLARENPKCNWAVETGNGLLILEVNTEFGLRSLRQLCQGKWGWRRTLEFRAAPSISSPSITRGAEFVSWEIDSRD